MIGYEAGSINSVVFFVEFYYYVTRLLPLLLKKGHLAEFEAPALCFFVSSTFSLPHMVMQTLSDPRLAGRCPWYWTSMRIAEISEFFFDMAVLRFVILLHEQVQSTRQFED